MAENETRRDKIDALIDALNAALPEIPFGRDAMELDTPENWGAVEMTGGRPFTADGRVIDMVYVCSVWAVTQDRSTETMDRVQDVLEEFAEEYGCKWQFPQRNWLQDIDRVGWQWTVQIPGPMEIEAEAGAAEDAGTDTEANG